MTIETKFDVGQEVWFLRDNKVVNEEINEIKFNYNGQDESTIYYFRKEANSNNWIGLWESEIFNTKEELIAKL